MAYSLHNLRPAPGSTKTRRRRGRGPGSGLGKTSGRGHKGQMSRRGAKRERAWFEGGQMPIQRRVPKRGFKNPGRVEFQVVNLRDLAKLVDVSEITPAVMRERRLIRDEWKPVKVLGVGEVGRAWTVKADAFSKTAVEKIKAAGGTVEVIG